MKSRIIIVIIITLITITTTVYNFREEYIFYPFYELKNDSLLLTENQGKEQVVATSYTLEGPFHGIMYNINSSNLINQEEYIYYSVKVAELNPSSSYTLATKFSLINNKDQPVYIAGLTKKPATSYNEKLNQTNSNISGYLANNPNEVWYELNPDLEDFTKTLKTNSNINGEIYITFMTTGDASDSVDFSLGNMQLSLEENIIQAETNEGEEESDEPNNNEEIPNLQAIEENTSTN